MVATKNIVHVYSGYAKAAPSDRAGATTDVNICSRKNLGEFRWV